MARKYTLAQRLRDPAKRAKLPTRLLSPAQQRERARLAAIAKDDTNPLYNPASQLTGHRLVKAVNQIVDATYAPQEAALDRQMVNARTQGGAVADRAAGYSRTTDVLAERAQAREQALSERLNQALSGIATTAAAHQQQARTEAQQGLSEDVALRGAGLAGGGDQAVANELAAQRARAATDAQTYRSAGALQGTNYEGLVGATRASTQLRGTELQGELATGLANDLAELRAKRADVSAQRGGEFTKQLLGLRQSGFENLVTTRGLGIKQSELDADVAKARAEIKLAAKRQAEVQRNNAANRRLSSGRLSESQRHNRVSESQGQQRIDKPPSARKTPEPAEARKLRVGIVNATEDFKTLISQPDQKGRARSPQRVAEILRKRGAPPIVAKAATELGQFGYVRPDTLRALRQAGIRVPAGWRAPKVVSQKRPG